MPARNNFARHAVARQGLTREAVNEIALRLLATYEAQAADAPLGSEYPECYDVAKAIPTAEHLQLFKRVKDEIAELGIEFPY